MYNNNLQGLGTDEADLIEILSTRNNHEIMAIRMKYRECTCISAIPNKFIQTVYHKDLESDIRGDTSLNLKRLLVMLSKGERDESHEVDMTRARDNADVLHTEASVKQSVGAEESNYIRFLALQNWEQIRLMLQVRVWGKHRDMCVCV